MIRSPGAATSPRTGAADAGGAPRRQRCLVSALARLRAKSGCKPLLATSTSSLDLSHHPRHPSAPFLCSSWLPVCLFCSLLTMADQTPDSWEDDLSKQTESVSLNSNAQPQRSTFRPEAASFQPGAAPFVPGQPYQPYGGYPQYGQYGQQAYGGYPAYDQQAYAQYGAYAQQPGAYNQMYNAQYGAYNQNMGYQQSTSRNSNSHSSSSSNRDRLLPPLRNNQRLKQLSRRRLVRSLLPTPTLNPRPRCSRSAVKAPRPLPPPPRRRSCRLALPPPPPPKHPETPRALLQLRPAPR